MIRSLLETDFYKLTMGQLVFHRYPNIPVRYRFKCRTKNIELGEVIPEERLREELDALREMRFTGEDVGYMRDQQHYPKLFKEDYLKFLLGLKLPEYELEYRNGDIHLEFPGLWHKAIYWETLALATINELYYRMLTEQDTYNRYDLFVQGMARLGRKITLLRQKPNIKITDFGTRRGFSRGWHDVVIRTLKDKIPGQLAGTSNVFLARKYNLKPIGTFAHEMPMVTTAMWRKQSDDWDAAIRNSHHLMLRDWWNEYGETLSIALTDTYGSDFFFNDMSQRQARKWSGLRHDSGDPVEFGEKAIHFYRSRGIDPSKKTIVFSDGLTVEDILRIQDHFEGRINLAYGWGTNLTNDLGPGTLSLVIKAVEACGYGTVKLSDNLAKAAGSAEDIEYFKKIFNYTGNNYEETVV